MLGFYAVIAAALLCIKRVALRLVLRFMRKKGYNQKFVVVVGSGPMARRYAETVSLRREMGYTVLGYVSEEPADWPGMEWMGTFDALEDVLDRTMTDEVVSAIDSAEYVKTPAIMAACEKAGVRLL